MGRVAEARVADEHGRQHVSGTGRDTQEIIDSHLHVWRLATGDYSWNTPSLGAVHSDFEAHDAATALNSSVVRSAILVQAADTVGDTERMLQIAQDERWVAGVVASVPLSEPERAEQMLDVWSKQPIVGIRQLVHDSPDANVLDAASVRRTCRLLAERGLPLDIPDAWPRLWPAVRRLARDIPELTIVIDHLGKPALGRESAAPEEQTNRWERDLFDLARFPNVTAKLSGLGAFLADGQTISAEAVAPFVEVALAAFGPERLMFGSDWPVCLAGGSYAEVADATFAALAALSRAESRSVLAGTARRVYRLPDRALTATA